MQGWRIRKSWVFSKKEWLCPLSHGFASPPLRPLRKGTSPLDPIKVCFCSHKFLMCPARGNLLRLVKTEGGNKHEYISLLLYLIWANYFFYELKVSPLDKLTVDYQRWSRCYRHVFSHLLMFFKHLVCIRILT